MVVQTSERAAPAKPITPPPAAGAAPPVTVNLSDASPANPTVVAPAPVLVPNAPPAANAPVEDAAWTRLTARSGSKIRIEGTSTVHDWQVESPLIGGYVDVGPGFPIAPGQSVANGAIPIRGELFVTARSLKSVQKDGKPYNDSMDQIMYEKLIAQQHPRLTFTVSGLSVMKNSDGAPTLTVIGELRVAGVARNLQVPVSIEPVNGGRLKISGSFRVKMTDFKIDPPKPVTMLLVTGDDVKILFEWMVAPKQPLAAR